MRNVNMEPMCSGTYFCFALAVQTGSAAAASGAGA